MGRIAEPEEIADAIVWLASEQVQIRHRHRPARQRGLHRPSTELVHPVSHGRRPAAVQAASTAIAIAKKRSRCRRELTGALVTLRKKRSTSSTETSGADAPGLLRGLAGVPRSRRGRRGRRGTPRTPGPARPAGCAWCPGTRRNAAARKRGRPTGRPPGQPFSVPAQLVNFCHVHGLDQVLPGREVPVQSGHPDPRLAGDLRPARRRSRRAANTNRRPPGWHRNCGPHPPGAAAARPAGPPPAPGAPLSHNQEVERYTHISESLTLLK